MNSIKRPFISICIPAYKRIDYLQRLLDSLKIQSFKDFEVVVTDDSPDESVYLLAKQYGAFLNLIYHKNEVPLGTPENWNKAISLSSGEWIKLMHDDDWFVNNESLLIFAKAANSNKSSFLFCAYENVFLDKGYSEVVYPQTFRLHLLSKDPVTLFSRNIIGPPSVVMHKNQGILRYDSNTKWVVDIGFYMERLRQESVYYIDQPLVKVGMSSLQVTVSCVNDKEILIKENFYLLQKQGWNHLRNIWVYDAFWRLIRNLKLQSVDEIYQNGFKDTVPVCLQRMIQFQSRLPGKILEIGLISKTFMAIHFIIFSRKTT